MAESPLLQVSNITKSYVGVQALKSASFELCAGEVHALIGENGAGKSTLIKIITGAVEPDSGAIELAGQTILHNSPRVARQLGIAAIYQQPALFPELTVAENIALGLEQVAMLGRVDWQARRRRAAELLSQVGAKIDVDTPACDLSMPQQQLVETARSIGAKAKVLIMDEPTASLSEEDTQNLFRVIRQLRASGAGIVYISHRLEELPVIADRVTVLRDGSTVGTRLMSEVNRQQLIQLMVGRELSAVFPKKEVVLGDVVLELRQLGCGEAGIKNINLAVRAGEIVGLFGLVGAGRTELARTIFGLTPADDGETLLHGKRVHIESPSQAIKRGIAYLPEDRRRHGVILDMQIGANITLASLDRLSRHGVMDFKLEKELAADYTRRLGIKTPAIFFPVGALSGGNQQKVALSRWLVTKPSALILDQPTQGIDVGSKSEIHALMTDLAAQGVAILMISSELPEILGMSDRVAVMHGGTIVAILNRAEATQQKILALALGHELSEVEAQAKATNSKR
ncbi:MAG: sugar ABC transporter ATP-binding protein [Acidobacteria bacterium]|nr:sugar ABC transporter ATP-binding protein [Acidobacteriota bacterium]